MQPARHVTATVLPGNRIEITVPELKEGDQVDVFLVVPGATSLPQRSALEIIESLGGQRLFQSPAEVDTYLKEERDSWDR